MTGDLFMKKYFIPLCLAGLLFFMSCSSYSNIETGQLAEQTIMDAKIPGLAFGIIEEGELVYEDYAGFADIDKGKAIGPETSFMIASISKPVTATAVMQLYEQGKLDLDAPVDSYLSFPLRHPDFPEQAITARMLLSHSSGILDNWDILDPMYTLKEGGDSPISLEEIVKGYLLPEGEWYDRKANFLKSGPGTKMRYCNLGYGILGYLVETISGTSFDQYCQRNIFNPLEMSHTTWFLEQSDIENLAVPYSLEKREFHPINHYGYPTYPDGQLRTTIGDYAKFLSVYMNQGRYGDQQILEPSSVEEMFRISNPERSEHQGLTWTYDPFESFLVNRIYAQPIIGHTGGDPGVCTYVVFDPEKKAGYIVFANGVPFTTSSQVALFIKLQKRLAEESGIMIK